jgi:hypothetical protein
MADMTRFDLDKVNVIGKLGTTPQERGLTTQRFKDKFDEGPIALGEFVNETLIPEVEAHLADSVKHITAEERTKWNAIDNLAGWKIYNDITELGLTPGTETMNAIVPAMQNKSELRFIKTTANLANMYPAVSGMLIVRKYANYRVECRFMQGANNGIVREWIAYYDANISPNFTGWKRVVTEDQIRNIILSPDEANAELMGDGDIWIQYEAGED